MKNKKFLSTTKSAKISKKELSKKEKLEVEKVVKKMVAEYKETLKLLGTT